MRQAAPNVIDRPPSERPEQTDHTDRAPQKPTPAELVLSHAALAYSLASRYRYRGESTSDLNQVAMLGLVKAANRYDSTRGVTFTTYATTTVLGELKRHFRDHRWTLHVGRTAQQRYLIVRDMIDETLVQLGRVPSVDELAQLTSLSQEQVRQAFQTANAFSTESIDAASSDGGHDQWRSLATSTDDVDRLVDHLAVRDAVKRLPDRAKTILKLRFRDGLSQSQISARTGVSQAHVSRVLAETLTSLRHQLAS